MNRPTARVLTLLELLQSGGARTRAELADRLGVDERTVRRYLGHLADLDVPVESVRGRYGGYRLRPGFRMPPLMLTDDEALAVLLGLVAGPRTGLRTAGDTANETATAKIRRVLPAHLADRLAAVLDAVAFTGPPDGAEPPEGAVLLALAATVRARQPVAIRYTDRHGRDSSRTIHPYGLVVHSGRWYLTAGDPVSGEQRTFRLDRIADARPRPGTFEQPAGADPARGVLTSIARAPYRHEVTVRVRGEAGDLFPPGLAEAGPPGADGWSRVELRAERLDWLPGLLASLGRPFVVERPDELRDLVAALADRLRAAAVRP